MIYTTLDNFYLTEEQLRDDSPSRRDGVDAETEAALRVYGCEIVQEAGILLSWPQAVMATGQVLFHRFYCKRSMKDFNVKARAFGVVFAACRVCVSACARAVMSAPRGR